MWSDGHKFCFGCQLYVPGYKGMSTEDIRKQIHYDDNKEKKARVVYLPADFTTDIPGMALEWLRKYYITDEEIRDYRIGWTDASGSLVFSAFDLFNNLLLVQLRTFCPERANFAKYYTRGYPETVLWSCGNRSRDFGPLVVVEDFVSAIRVGRTQEAMPLWGSGLSLNQIQKISDRWDTLILWLDWDKAGHAMKLREKALPYFKSVKVVASEKDPKEYTDERIAETLGQIQ